MRDPATADEAAEERRLWADYYEASAHAVALVRAGAATEAALAQIVAADAKAAAAIRRIKEIRGIHD